MIQIFNHYVPGRAIVLAAIEALVMLIAIYFSLFLQVAGPGEMISGLGLKAAVSPQAVGFTLAMTMVISSMGLYQVDLGNNNQSIAVRMIAAFLLGFAVTWLVSYLVPSLKPAPIALGTTVIAALMGSVLVRTAFHNWSNVGAFRSRVLVLGTGSRVMRLAEYAPRNPNHQVIGYISLQSSSHYVPMQQILPATQGESLLSIVKKYAIDQIVVAVRDRRGGGLPLEELLECKMAGVRIVELPTFFEREYRQVLLESLNPSWMVFGDGFREGSFRNAAKRLFDLIVSGVLLVIALPIMLLVALCIFLESGLPVLYSQKRVGQGGRVFTIYKFRSMKKEAESDGTSRWAQVNDDRTTIVGRFIRKWRIDELPQIYNVLRGEMSLVGPRPERPCFVDQLAQQIPFYALRHSAKPGITGWAQVRYPYGASIDDAIEKLQYDLYYLKNRSLFLDLMILIATVEVVLWGKGAR